VKHRLALLIVLTLPISGCTLREALLMSPKGQALSRELEARQQAAYTLGENRGFLLVNGGKYPELVIREVQVAMDAQIKAVAVADSTRTFTTGRVRMVLLAAGVDDSDAQAALEELNGVCAEAPLLISAYAGKEKLAIAQRYLLGFSDGVQVALKEVE